MKLIFESDAGKIEAEAVRKGSTLNVSSKELKAEWEVVKSNGPATLLRTPTGFVRAHLVRQKDEVFIHVHGRALRLKDVTEEAGREDSSHSSDLKVVAPMPGTVIKVLVEAGQTVKRGEALVIVEAMKMENEVRAPGAALVNRVLVKAGEKVGFGQQLIELTPPAESGGETGAR